jgi:hypothetical protein
MSHRSHPSIPVICTSWIRWHPGYVDTRKADAATPQEEYVHQTVGPPDPRNSVHPDPGELSLVSGRLVGPKSIHKDGSHTWLHFRTSF